jgi:hypothetical protein
MNVRSKRNKNKRTKIIFCWRLEGHFRKEQDPEPDPESDPPRDPFVKETGTDPKIRILT